MHALAKSFQPHVWVNAHSGMEALFMPYDHRSAHPAAFWTCISWFSMPSCPVLLHLPDNCSSCILRLGVTL